MGRASKAKSANGARRCARQACRRPMPADRGGSWCSRPCQHADRAPGDNEECDCRWCRARQA